MISQKVATFIKIAQDEAQKDIDAVKRFARSLPDKSYYDKGMLYRPCDLKTLKIGYDGDGFARNLFTVAFDQRVYRKVPGILKYCYRVKKYQPRRNHSINKLYKKKYKLRFKIKQSLWS